LNLWRAKAHELIPAQARIVADLARETSNEPATLTNGKGPAGHRSAEGDPHRLRGIPMFARGIGGTMPGTQPHSALRDRAA